MFCTALTASSLAWSVRLWRPMLLPTRLSGSLLPPSLPVAEERSRQGNFHLLNGGRGAAAAAAAAGNVLLDHANLPPVCCCCCCCMCALHSILISSRAAHDEDTSPPSSILLVRLVLYGSFELYPFLPSFLPFFFLPSSSSAVQSNVYHFLLGRVASQLCATVCKGGGRGGWISPLAAEGEGGEGCRPLARSLAGC
jgi:hypothetical protein